MLKEIPVHLLRWSQPVILFYLCCSASCSRRAATVSLLPPPTSAALSNVRRRNMRDIKWAACGLNASACSPPPSHPQIPEKSCFINHRFDSVTPPPLKFTLQNKSQQSFSVQEGLCHDKSLANIRRPEEKKKNVVVGRTNRCCVANRGGWMWFPGGCRW